METLSLVEILRAIKEFTGENLYPIRFYTEGLSTVI
jgi:hypothetical protein